MWEKYHLTAYFLSKISAKKISKLFDVSRCYSKPKQGRLLRHRFVLTDNKLLLQYTCCEMW